MIAGGRTELTCREIVELVTDYLEDALSAEERARFELHLAACAGCAAYVRQLRDTIAVAGRLTERSLSDEARERLLAAFRGWRRGRPPA